jgi:hypothetical protein
MGMNQESCDVDTGLYCKKCGEGYGDSAPFTPSNTCVQCPVVDGCTASNARCDGDGGNPWCATCGAKEYGTLGNDVEGNQCQACTGNEGNALNCVNGDYHRCAAADGTLSTTSTWCDHCNAKSYGSLGDGVEGNQCTVCEGNDDNALNCVNGDYHRCAAADGTKSATSTWCDHCDAKSYGSLGAGVEGNQCTVCEGNDGNALNCVNGDYHRCTSPGGDGTKSLTPTWCDHCNAKSYGSLGAGVEGNQCTVCEGNDDNVLNCVNGDYHRCQTATGTKSATPVWCDHCDAKSYGSLGAGVEGNQCTVCEGNDGNSLNCVNGDYHRCQTATGIKSATPTWCDHCTPGSTWGGGGNLGAGVEGNKCY